MCQRTTKLMTMHKALYPNDDTDRLFLSRKEGRRRFPTIEDSIDASIRGLKDYIKKRKETLITVASNSNDELRNRKTKTMRQKREEKQQFGYFK